MNAHSKLPPAKARDADSLSVVVRELIQIQHRAAEVDDGLLGGCVGINRDTMLLYLVRQELQRQSLFLTIGSSAERMSISRAIVRCSKGYGPKVAANRYG